MKWYEQEKLSPNITRITDIASVACYLIEGSTKACLLDTCCGYGNLREYVEEITDLPITVILTHGHYDHTGSASLFDDVWMNPKDLCVLEKHRKKREFFLEEDKKSISSLSSIAMSDLNPPLLAEPKHLADGQVIDLGGLHLEMIEVPGHTPGMTCALLKEERVMFFGDACGMNVLLHDEFASDIQEYRQSLLKLKSYENRYDQIYRNHGSYTNRKDLLDNVIECCDLIMAGKDDHFPVSMYGKTLYAAKRTENGKRADGRQGNIIYSEEKRK